LLFFLSCYFYRSSGSGVVPSPSQRSEQRSEVSPLSCSGGKQIQSTDQNTTEVIANCVKQQRRYNDRMKMPSKVPTNINSRNITHTNKGSFQRNATWRLKHIWRPNRIPRFQILKLQQNEAGCPNDSNEALCNRITSCNQTWQRKISYEC
jgi:hypothetical protein